MKNLVLILISILFFAACSSKQQPKTIYIVRHAEKQLDGNDPELSIAGNARARKLAQILADQKITHVFSTDYKRTRLTAAPTANEAGVEIKVYDPKNQDALVEQLRSIEGNVLVVGHSNTVSKLANKFVDIAEPYMDLAETEYNFIYVIQLRSNGIKVSRKVYKDF
ncbi:Histidine phosphatase superfamily (branch 1) [Algoriphagus locisalis]|uniref:Histidine phosphatase superfamily (Branch 1) n=1 Tax=Algoriphagus locisalis TaxID=305507 RepID=A0A1I7ABW2_9BACT|nr:phosphoglycerate mutase family protein [Algoriphagus locisalis]SFT72422.1 Histidine phosphatase superfamily (branch 1) [Algoriphagus locisalis]